MKIELYIVSMQFFITPYIEITYDKYLNGYYEFMIGWGKWGVSLKWWNDEKFR